MRNEGALFCSLVFGCLWLGRIEVEEERGWGRRLLLMCPARDVLSGKERPAGCIREVGCILAWEEEGTSGLTQLKEKEEKKRSQGEKRTGQGSGTHRVFP